MPGAGEATFEFRKTQKILDRSEFLELSREGRKSQDDYFIVLCLPGKFSWPRIGITVSKRVGNAVVRNRVKRLVREWFRLRRLDAIQALDVSVIAKKSAAGLSLLEVSRSLDRLSAKIRGC